MASWIDTANPIVVVVALAGCASRADAQPSPKAPASEPIAAIATSPRSAASAPNATTSPAPSPAEDPPAAPAPDPMTGESPRALPELALQLSGLHIGGGPNDAVTKRPFIETLESGFEAMRACYPKIEQPEKGGTFGVDLRVERSGGHPTIQAVRTAMKGDAFKACVESAIRALDFGRPPQGPTVLSASVRFTLR